MAGFHVSNFVVLQVFVSGTLIDSFTRGWRSTNATTMRLGYVLLLKECFYVLFGCVVHEKDDEALLLLGEVPIAYPNF